MDPVSFQMISYNLGIDSRDTQMAWASFSPEINKGFTGDGLTRAEKNALASEPTADEVAVLIGNAKKEEIAAITDSLDKFSSARQALEKDPNALQTNGAARLAVAKGLKTKKQMNDRLEGEAGRLDAIIRDHRKGETISSFKEDLRASIQQRRVGDIKSNQDQQALDELGNIDDEQAAFAIPGIKANFAEFIVKNRRLEAERRAASVLLGSAATPADRAAGRGAEVMCLQEVGDLNRPMIAALGKTHDIYHVSNPQGPIDCAIAINRDKFVSVVNHSKTLVFQRYGEDTPQDCAIVAATEKATGKRILFVSVHVPGFSYRLTPENIREEALEGDSFCQALVAELDRLKSGANIDAEIIGADVNASPEKYAARFKIVTDKGFQTKRTGSPTNVHFMDDKDQIREIDYFFARATKAVEYAQKPWYKRVFTRQPKSLIKLEARSFAGFGFDMASNPSDHKPIVAKVTIGFGKAPSLGARFRSWLSSLSFRAKKIG